MRVGRRSSGDDRVEYEFELEGRRYRAVHQGGGDATILANVAPCADDLEAVADYLVQQDGVRRVYFLGERLRPEIVPRPLRPAEQALLDHLLAIDDPRVAPLREQAKRALVVDDLDSPRRLVLHVPADAAPPAGALWPRGPAIEAPTIRNDGTALLVRLWLDREYLDAIEVDWYDREPTEVPRPAELAPAVLWRI